MKRSDHFPAGDNDLRIRIEKPQESRRPTPIDIHTLTGPEDEVRRLQGCLGDLISVMALPALWSGRDAAAITTAVLEGLVGMLRLDFAYARLHEAVVGTPMEFIRVGNGHVPRVAAEAVGQRLVGYRTREAPGTRRRVRNPMGDGSVLIAFFAIGIHDELGLVVVGSEREDFPTAIEELLVQVAVNQAAIGLQEARRVDRAEAKTRTLASLVEHSGDFIGVASLDGEVMFVNPAGRKLTERTTGRTPERVVEYVFPADRHLVEESIWPAVLAGKAWDGELRLLNAVTGEALPMLVHAFMIRDPASGHPVAVATISRDMSAAREAEEALRRAREELAHVGRVTTMGELTASIAHEVNQPLGAIVTNAHACLHWLKGPTPNMAEGLAAAQRIIRDANRASDVIRGIRAFLTRGAAARTEIALEDLVADVIELTRDEAAAHGVTILFVRKSGVPPVFGDRTQLQQVVLNLVMNAIEALAGMSEGPRLVEISVYREGADEVRVCVRDSGPGIDPAKREQVFEAFHTSKPNGMGLGLAISRSILEAHGGRIWAMPNADAKGETLVLSLPIAPGQAS
jgi:PAS domain S-box-containing protein